jgi:hypothetical protein
MSDRFAVLVFRVSDDTDYDRLQDVVAQIEAPPDWTFEAGDVVLNSAEYKHLMWNVWE